jgi:hypothetical protein
MDIRGSDVMSSAVVSASSPRWIGPEKQLGRLRQTVTKICGYNAPHNTSGHFGRFWPER